MRDIRIAAVVMNCPVGDVEDNLDRMDRLVKIAAENQVEIICFPELNVTGYCNRPEMARAALTIDSPEVNRIREMARSERVVILAGLAEKGADGTVFASHLLIHRDGSIDVYRKLHIAPPEKSIFSPGNNIPVFEAAGIRFGIQLCYDAHFPELASAMADRGAEVIFLPHASPRGDARQKHTSWMRHLPARAFDNSLFIVANNQTGENCNGLSFPGNAVVIDPAGNIIEKRLTGGEGLLVVDLKKADFDNVRSHEMRFFFPNRRPELYGD